MGFFKNLKTTFDGKVANAKLISLDERYNNATDEDEDVVEFEDNAEDSAAINSVWANYSRLLNIGSGFRGDTKDTKKSATVNAAGDQDKNMLMARVAFNAIYNVMKKRGYDDTLSNDIGNLFAGFIVEDADNIDKLDKISSIPISTLIDRMRKGGYTESRILNVISALDKIGDDDNFDADMDLEMSTNPAILQIESQYKSEDSSAAEKPFTMNLNQFIQSNPAIMPTLI